MLCKLYFSKAEKKNQLLDLKELYSDLSASWKKSFISSSMKKKSSSMTGSPKNSLHLPKVGVVQAVMQVMGSGG